MRSSHFCTSSIIVGFNLNILFIDFERLVEMEEYCLYKRLLISPIMLTGKISVYSIKEAVTHEITVAFLFVVKNGLSQ